MKSLFLLVGMVLLIGGCAQPRLIGRPDLTIVDQTSLPAPMPADLVEPGRPYLIGPFDRISVEVFGVEALTRTVQADATGRVSLPLAGDINVSGKSPDELAAIIADRLRGRYVRNPQVTVNLAEAISQTVTVGGDVQQPGQYPVIGRMTLLRAITRAQGTTEFARTSHVVVFRTVGRQQMAALFDLRAIQQGIYPDPEIYAHDVVMVGDDAGRRVFHDIIQGSGLLTAPLIAILNRV